MFNKNDAKEVIKNYSIASHDWKISKICQDLYKELDKMMDTSFSKSFKKKFGKKAGYNEFFQYIDELVKNKLNQDQSSVKEKNNNKEKDEKEL